MTLTIELPPDVERWLLREGQLHGMTATDYAKQLIEKSLPNACESSLAELVNAWVREDASDDPEELKARDVETLEFKSRMNANRVSSGERPVYE